MNDQSSCAHIIVVEDDPDIREALRQFIELEGYNVEVYSNGKEAIDALQRYQDPCLILLDLMMPVMDGFEFLKHRRNLGDTVVSIPVVIVSAYSEQAQTIKGEVNAILRKPVDMKVVLAIVRRYCGDPPQQNQEGLKGKDSAT